MKTTRSRLMAAAAASLFALGLAACEQGERPTTDGVPPAGNTSPSSPGGSVTPPGGGGGMGSSPAAPGGSTQ